MHLTRYPGILLLLALAFYNAGTSAQALSGPGPRDGQRLVDDEISSTEGFLNGHPDQRWRRMGLSAYDRKVFGFAREYFRRAARYADKASQAMYAQMLWDGQGGAVDRPLAYAWMDLAAERGYRSFVAFRESYWSQLSPVEREQAVSVGQAVYDQYGDAVAQPRLESVMRRERLKTTGSHTGFDRGASVYMATSTGQRIRVHRFWDARYWQPEEYWDWQAEVWEAPGHSGRVEVLPLLPTDGPAPRKARDPAK
ncbi:MAG: hypothetical protein CVV18_06685 [Gammaproteobacteria bacterium HGW-Gammaproteobacteria-8]|jgi:hypothetical protein|nr:MAG: hypothetical protein CVV18_06685 [Gammaproteobacteria bacterium HGW-Gammaproteobacteria-8]PKM14336.1 MAG: hypothetical protein CVV12_14460 [Gammaproteobacteria bacterium HGW-Gammaproteobacteria-2]